MSINQEVYLKNHNTFGVIQKIDGTDLLVKFADWQHDNREEWIDINDIATLSEASN